jgi:hypothetical protein
MRDLVISFGDSSVCCSIGCVVLRGGLKHNLADGALNRYRVFALLANLTNISVLGFSAAQSTSGQLT